MCEAFDYLKTKAGDKLTTTQKRMLQEKTFYGQEKKSLAYVIGIMNMTTIVVLHPLTDYRRILPIEKTGETLIAAPGFQLVISYNPGYQRMLKDLKPSTRQRFVALDFDFPSLEHETQIVQHEAGIERPQAHALVTLARRLRELRDRGLAEVPSTRLLVAAGRLMASGIEPCTACRHALIAPLSDDPALLGAMHDLVDATFV